MDSNEGRPGTPGEIMVQDQLGSAERAVRFHQDQMTDRLNETMVEFIGRQEMFFLATADARGECDNTFRAGPPGFLTVLDDRTVAWPEYRGNGVHASLGNIIENPHVGLILVDFVRDLIGLHLNGSAELLAAADFEAQHSDVDIDDHPGRRSQVWVRVTLDEAYIHCAKHIPRMIPAPRNAKDRDWGTDNAKRKGGDFFAVTASRRIPASAE